MSELTISTVDAIGALVDVNVNAELTDLNGHAVAGELEDGSAVVRSYSERTVDGVLSIDLTANALITRPANTYWTVVVGNTAPFLVEKGAGSESLFDAEAIDPQELDPAFGLGNLAGVDLTGLVDGDTIVYDFGDDLWRPGAQSGGGGQVDEVTGAGVISVDATDPTAPQISFTGAAADIPYDPDDAAFVNGATVQAALDSAEVSLQDFSANVAAEVEARENGDGVLSGELLSETVVRAAEDALLIPLTQKGAASGVATLDGSGKVPDDQLDVADLADVPDGTPTKIIGVDASNDIVSTPTATLTPAASAVLAGLVELATNAETVTGTDTVRATTPAGVKAAIDALVAAAPGALDTLDELAAALGDDANFAATTATALGGKVAKSDYNANTVLVATTDDTPVPVTMGASTVLARKASGGIVAATAAETKAILALTFSDIAAGTSTMPGGGTIQAGDLGASFLNQFSSHKYRTVGAANDGLVVSSVGFSAGVGTAAPDVGLAPEGTNGWRVNDAASGGGFVRSVADPLVADDLSRKSYVDTRSNFAGTPVKPTGAIAMTTADRNFAVGNLASLSTGRLTLVAVNLPAGVVTSITFVTRTTALVAGTHQWFGLFSGARVCLRVTGDDTSTAWAANAPKTLNLSSTYTITTPGTYYLGIMVEAGTVPTLSGPAGSTAVVLGIAPITCGTSDTGLTTPFTVGNTAAAITASTIGVPFAYPS